MGGFFGVTSTFCECVSDECWTSRQGHSTKHVDHQSPAESMSVQSNLIWWQITTTVKEKKETRYSNDEGDLAFFIVFYCLSPFVLSFPFLLLESPSPSVFCSTQPPPPLPPALLYISLLRIDTARNASWAINKLNLTQLPQGSIGAPGWSYTTKFLTFLVTVNLEEKWSSQTVPSA